MLAPDMKRDEEVVYERRDGSDTPATVVNVDISIWPPSYALRISEKDTSDVHLDTNPNRLWPPATRAVMKADAAMDALLEEEAAEPAASGKGAKGKGGKGGKGK